MSAQFVTLRIADGNHSLLAMAERAGIPFGQVREMVQILERHGLLREATSED